MGEAGDQQDGATRPGEPRRHPGVPTPSKATALFRRGEQRAVRFLWVFLPETSIARSRQFHYLLASTFLSDGGRDALKYGALVAVTRSSGSSIDAVLIGVASLLPPTLLGLYGGAVADAFPKRVALAIIYLLQGGLCFVVPTFLGTNLGAVIALIFALNVLGEVSTPDEQSVAPLVASDEQLATATSLLSLASNVGTAVGTALLAPILLRVVGVQAVFWAAGTMLLLASGRIWQVRSERDLKTTTGYHRPSLNVREILGWLADEPAVATMMMVGVLAGTATVVLQTLAPRYVQSVLGLDPAEAVYVFAPTSIGLVLALVSTPGLMHRIGERRTALLGFLITATSLFLLGLVRHHLVVVVDPINPFRLLGAAGLHLGGPLRTASFLVMPLGFGVAATTMSVQTFINRRVPLAHQGRMFALQSTVKNGVTIIPLVTLGIAASVAGVDTVLIASPVLLFALAFLLVVLSEHFGSHAPFGRLEALESFWRDPTVPPVEPQPGVSS
jgi:MFS family permease